jgi:serine/threonine-protein kinase
MATKGTEETGLVVPASSDEQPEFVWIPSRLGEAMQESGILDNLDATIGAIPRVLLRDSPAEGLRPVRPGSSEMPAPPGNRGRYQLLGEIARGGMGAVLQGRDVDLGRDLAVKVILEEHLHHPEIVRRFVEEAQIGGQLQHPGIVPVHELGQFPDGRLYIAMKLVKGRTLAVLLESRKDLTDDRSRFLAIFEQVCQTIAYAHARGVVHRDLKPSNVMVGNFGEIQVMDWGLAKVLDQGGIADEEKVRKSQLDRSAIRTVRAGSGAESHAGSVLGTPAYMAPEQARGALDMVDERADVFGLGSILCEILTGSPAYTGTSSPELYRKAERADLGDALARLDACGADAELVALARSCLAPAAKDRPRDAGVVLTALTEHLASVEERLRAAELAQVKAEARAAEEHKRRILTIALAASLLATVLLGGVGWAWVKTEREARERKLANQQRARSAQTVAAIIEALEDARHKLGQAQAAGRESEQWVEAREAVKRAESLLARGEGGSELTGRVRALQAEIARKRDEAEAVGKDRRMVERLAEIHNDLAVHEDASKTDAQFAEAFRNYGVNVEELAPEEAGTRLAQHPVAAELANALDQWAFIRRGQQPAGLEDPEGARHLVAIARAADPDPWRNQLRDLLDADFMRPDRREAGTKLEELAASADTDALPEASITRLAWVLAHGGRNSTAVALLQRSQRAHPHNFWLNFVLGIHLWLASQPEEAVRFYSVAVAIHPQSRLALHSLGTVLQELGRLDEAAATLRQAIHLHPDDATGHIKLGAVLFDLGEVRSAHAEFQEAKRLDPENLWLRIDLARGLMDRGEWNMAIDELRQDLRRDPRCGPARDLLGLALQGAGRLDEAIASFRAAIDSDPPFPLAYANLGRALLVKGDCAEALSLLRRHRPRGFGERNREFVSNDANRAERMLALEPQLTERLASAEKPREITELVDLARLCAIRQHYPAACRLWGQAFKTDPQLADELRLGVRYEAACVAAQAARAPAADQPDPQAVSRESLRKQALDWLKADLAAYARILESGTLQSRAMLPRRLGRWRVDPALAELHDDAALAALPEAERQAWRALWDHAETLRKQVLKKGLPAGRGPPPGKFPNRKPPGM